MKTFFLKLISPRPSFVQDMSPAEAKLMGEHAAYWQGRMAQGEVVVFGPVADPAGPYGIGIIEVDSDAAAQQFAADDPVIKARGGFRYDIQPMPRGALRPRGAD